MSGMFNVAYNLLTLTQKEDIEYNVSTYFKNQRFVYNVSTPTLKESSFRQTI